MDFEQNLRKNNDPNLKLWELVLAAIASSLEASQAVRGVSE